jgi:drug/metabolite transporter (DMT)-like permease
VIAILGGLAAAFLWGTSTLVAARSTRMLGSQQALAYVMLIGLVATAGAAFAVEGLPPGTATGWAWAITAGAASALGLSSMYRALRIGKVGVVAPIASTEGAFAAMLSVVVLDESLTVQITLALAVVVAGVLVVTFHGSVADIHLRPSLFAIAAAGLFGIGLVASSQAGDELGAFWTILVARIMGIALIALPLLARRRLAPPGQALPLVTYSALAESGGFAAFIAGAQHSVAVAAVLASQFAAVAVFGSYVAFGERLGRQQLAGAVVIAVGVAAVAALRA